MNADHPIPAGHLGLPTAGGRVKRCPSLLFLCEDWVGGAVDRNLQVWKSARFGWLAGRPAAQPPDRYCIFRLTDIRAHYNRTALKKWCVQAMQHRGRLHPETVIETVVPGGHQSYTDFALLAPVVRTKDSHTNEQYWTLPLFLSHSSRLRISSLPRFLAPSLWLSVFFWSFITYFGTRTAMFGPDLPPLPDRTAGVASAQNARH